MPSHSETHQSVSPKTLAAILDSLTIPILFADTNHIICYLNRAAANQYDEGYGLLGKSLLNCHEAASQKIMQAILDDMQQGLGERLITDDEKHRIFMRAVRDENGKLLGYFERYESPKNTA